MLAMIVIFIQRKVWSSCLYSVRALGERASSHDNPSPTNRESLFAAYLPLQLKLCQC